MKGKHHIMVENDHVRYEFDIKRNITVIQGDSATGKTSLLDLLRQYSMRKEGSGVLLQSDKKCVVYGGTIDNWKPVIEAEHDSIIFIDEDYPFVFSKDFAATIKNTDNYYVLISRRPLKELPYSTQEIYGIRTSGKYHFPEKVYNEFYPLYPDTEKETTGKGTILVVEDANSGYQFWENVCGSENCICAGGNANIYNTLVNIKNNSVPLTVIADGAAFGAFIEGILSIAEIRKDVSIYLPESFEWLILKAGVIDSANIRDILSSPENYIESSRFFSWERFFTELLKDETADDPVKKYNKSQLAAFYLQKKSIDKIKNVIPNQLQKMLF